jgi:hypothetical protein
LKEFKAIRFQITPRVDAKEAEAFVHQVERLEGQLTE